LGQLRIVHAMNRAAMNCRCYELSRYELYRYEWSRHHEYVRLDTGNASEVNEFTNDN